MSHSTITQPYIIFDHRNSLYSALSISSTFRSSHIIPGIRNVGKTNTDSFILYTDQIINLNEKNGCEMGNLAIDSAYFMKIFRNTFCLPFRSLYTWVQQNLAFSHLDASLTKNELFITKKTSFLQIIEYLAILVSFRDGGGYVNWPVIQNVPSHIWQFCEGAVYRESNANKHFNRR